MWLKGVQREQGARASLIPWLEKPRGPPSPEYVWSPRNPRTPLREPLMPSSHLIAQKMSPRSRERINADLALCLVWGDCASHRPCHLSGPPSQPGTKGLSFVTPMGLPFRNITKGQSQGLNPGLCGSEAQVLAHKGGVAADPGPDAVTSGQALRRVPLKYYTSDERVSVQSSPFLSYVEPSKSHPREAAWLFKNKNMDALILFNLKKAVSPAELEKSANPDKTAARRRSK